MLAFVLAGIVDRALRSRGDRLAAAVTRGDITPGVDTRLRFLRRAIYLVIVVIGLAIALSQFASINRLAASVLASGVLAAAIIGFAARQTLANIIAGIMLAITQPLRIGDHVVFEGDAGVVEDVRLTYTYLRGGDGQRIIIPNERLASGTLRNDTIVDPGVTAQASVWIAPDADAERAAAVLARGAQRQRSRSPRSRTRASGCRSPTRWAPRATAPSGRPPCGPERCDACARQGSCLGRDPLPAGEIRPTARLVRSRAPEGSPRDISSS